MRISFTEDVQTDLGPAQGWFLLKINLSNFPRLKTYDMSPIKVQIICSQNSQSAGTSKKSV